MHERLLDNIVKMKGELDLAIDDYTNRVQFKPKYFQVYINRGEIFSKKSKFNFAIRDYAKVIEVNTDLSLN